MTGEINLLKQEGGLKGFNLQTFESIESYTAGGFLKRKQKSNKKPSSSGCFLYDDFCYSDFSLSGRTPSVVFAKH